MGFLRRLRGRGSDDRGPASDDRTSPPKPGTIPSGPSEPSSRGIDDRLSEDEVERERALFRADAERLDDPLLQRQLRYADRSWTPPREGGERRADDADSGSS